MKQVHIFFIIGCLLGGGNPVQAVKVKYPVSQIPSELLKDAKSVIRYSNKVFEVHDDRKATHTVKYAVTILNSDNLDQASLLISYDKFSRLSDIQGVIYDAEGKKIRNIQQDEIIDLSLNSGYSLFEDHRCKYIDVPHKTLPFTVEYSYVEHYTGILSYPIWTPAEGFYAAVEHSTYSVILPEGNELRYREQNMPVQPVYEKINSKSEYTWQVNNLSALKLEPLSPPPIEYFPAVFTAPADFMIDGYEGNAESWLNLGYWSRSLIEGRDALPDEAINRVKEMTADCKTDEEKVRILYKYLQENTRYVSIQEGIGGWQPIDAATVHRLKYGDCKALSNYMKALLKAADIKAIYSRVIAGAEACKLMKDFPSNQFNHVILCVPMDSDTMWLECTNQHNPCGYLGTFTDDRDVLLITDEGGKVVHTPAYSAGSNVQLYTATVLIDQKGDAMASMSNSFGGIHYDENFSLLLGDREDKRRKIYERITIPNFEVISCDHSEVPGPIPSIEERIELWLRNYAPCLGDRIFIPLNLLNRLEPLPYDRDERTTAIQIRREWLELDTIRFIIPEGYVIESIPDKQETSNKYADYKFEAEVDNSTIIYKRYLKVKKGTFLKEEYSDFYTYVERLSVLDNAKAVIIKISE